MAILLHLIYLPHMFWQWFIKPYIYTNIISVSDPLHFNVDPDLRIRFQDNRSGSGFSYCSGSGSDSGSDKQIPIFFFLIFFCNRYKTHSDVFVVVILSLLFTYIKQNKWVLFKKYSYNFGRYVCELITIYFLLPGSGSTFPEVDPVLNL